MKWTQVIDPFNNIYISALVAVVPILFIFWALIIKKMKGYKASLLTTVIALVVAIGVYRMPVQLAVLSTVNGAVYGLFPICWIIVSAVFLFNLTVESGQFEVIKHFMASITSDRRMQALLIAFSFGSFLEGTAGFGAPVAITAAMLVGLGFEPLYAAGICLVANTAPVAFGAIGIPISVASQVSGIPEMAISQMVGRTLPVLSLLLPFYLIIIMAGWKKTREVWPAILVSAGSFAFFQWSISNFLGPALPDVIAGLGSIVCLVVFLKYWKIKKVWRFSHEPPPTIQMGLPYSTGQIVRACSPFILLTIMIIAWGLKPIKYMLDSVGLVSFKVPGLHNLISDANGKLIPHVFNFNYLSAAGTAIFISALISVPLVGLSGRQATKIFMATLKQIKYPIITVSAILGFAYLVNDSGITITMAQALAGTGVLFPFFAPVLGWLGVFITGSDTSANALFGKLQAATATSIGVDPVVTVAANVSGGVVGKMISPTSIAVAAAAGGLVGRESDLFRFSFKHSFIMLSLICVIVLMQAYLFKWLIPVYHVMDKKAALLAMDKWEGSVYLLGLAVVLITLSVFVLTRGKKRKLIMCWLAPLFMAAAVHAQTGPITRSAIPQPAFEVGASIYPWDVHDEGIDLILDNLTGMAGVNSVYLIAVMHEERRPFNSDHLPGSFYYIHNPVRTEWPAEDSRVYFHPDMSAYGKIKPLFSSFDWLNQTDYLKIVLDKAHARGLRAGVEVSHTYIPVSVLNEHPEYKQRDINDKPVDRPCPNNPDVRAYLLALYGDLAQHYDVDYVQTCMLLFTRSDDPRDGTCFCASCKKKASAMGFDLEAARTILKDNPSAQPELGQWLGFRKACTTEIYQLVTDRLHQVNPAIDFRLNDLNDRSSGLTLEDLKSNINSVHLSTHTEQNGYQRTDRASRIRTTHYYLGQDKLVIAGVPARLLSTPALVKSSIKISVDAGAKGVAIKHYDGAAYSNLRAFRNGLSEAGVAGFQPIRGVEAEDMQLTGYQPGEFLNEKGISTTGTGTAVVRFDQPTGIYDLIVSYADEKGGKGSLSLLVDGRQKSKWVLSEDVGCWRRKTISGLKIRKGAEIRIVGLADGGESARVDFIEYVSK